MAAEKLPESEAAADVLAVLAEVAMLRAAFPGLQVSPDEAAVIVKLLQEGEAEQVGGCMDDQFVGCLR
jgi:hypothetical protein